MSRSTNNEFGFKRLEFTNDLPMTTITSTTNQRASLATAAPIEVLNVAEIIVNLYVKYNYPELNDFVRELQEPNEHMKINGQSVSILNLYALVSTKDPIDMSNQTKRMTYRPNLFVRKNDMYGPWNFKYLLNLFELDYQCATDNDEFPKVWKTAMSTKVHVKIISNFEHSDDTKETQEQSKLSAEDITLLGLLKTICLQNKCDESDANIWLKALKEENISTIEHLRLATANETTWEKVAAVKYLVKQMIRDYVQLNMASQNVNEMNDPYKDSKATLLGDIHRVRRYFHYVNGQLNHVSYLDRHAVNRAIEEIRLTYDDDGNVLNNIQNYLRTFCLHNRKPTETERIKQRQGWTDELRKLEQNISQRQTQVDKLHRQAEEARKCLEDCNSNYLKLVREEKNVEETVNKLIEEAITMAAAQYNNKSWQQKHDQGRQMRSDYYAKRQRLERELIEKRESYNKAKNNHVLLASEIESDQRKIYSLKELLELKLEDEHRKLNVKFGRGLLLYGPPGTGKSELLKRAAIFAGITMTTPPLAAGELNRPYVGETEKLLIDIMYRANTIPYLICAMTIDEIDGLVPKRDNNAQQSKVDGISVLLSHIEGVKNIPNLIVLGATNRRNMMDEAFLRRMQAKCFVGRPSPQVRKKMLRPLLCKNSNSFTNERLDFLVKVSTNFSGAAVGALKSSIIVALDDVDEKSITDLALLELADNVAREFSCWFGIGTLPEIVQIYPNLFQTQKDHKLEEYSLNLPKTSPTGRILVDLRERKCLIELSNEPTLEKALDDGETSMLTLIARFIHGCSTRNIDTIQIIDLNFLIKQNAFEENQIFELLTTTFLECNEYNRSMLIFDIDSLVMLTVSDSKMSKSESISNIRLYQFIREKCKTAKIEQVSENNNVTVIKEKWMVIVVKHPLLRQLIIDDIEFKKTSQQLQKENDDEKKRIDDEVDKVCPKCHQNYIPSKTTYGNCHYHDGFIYDLEANVRLSKDQAQALLQNAKLKQQGNSEQQPKLIWACCLGIYGSDPPCRVGMCGLPEELKASHSHVADPRAAVEEYFMNNQVADAKIKKFLETFRKTPKGNNSATSSTTLLNSKK
ncbi:unnamed protein product [Rotaria magnacalcarata]|uniref:AAA+ ATPase domain-containing protein n=1 Tax=Rotaria magnacalcarata TaxID=392030 RepID=A0A816RRI0_9BILA|nr:unnamed protein product [Rotaria magnacalcarata]CAF3867092.1 unnamed protein product [Rotaria magnacalcarata]